MTDDPVQMLVQEVEDLLDAGEVGLYEFMWILNGEKVEGTRAQHLVLAQQALDRLLKGKRGRLISLMWAQPNTEEDLGRDFCPEDFDDPPKDAPYVAISRD